MNILSVLLLPRIVPGVQTVSFVQALMSKILQIRCLDLRASDSRAQCPVHLHACQRSSAGRNKTKAFQKQLHGVSRRIECVIFIWCFHHEIVSKARQVLMRRFEPFYWNGKNQHGRVTGSLLIYIQSLIHCDCLEGLSISSRFVG